MKRNYGIDLAKFSSMFMVIILHNLLNGGVLIKNVVSVNNMAYWYLENLSIIAVNVFAITSGFLMVNKRIKFKRILDLWLIVIFWSVIPTIIIMSIRHSWNVLVIVKSFFPFITKQYWYFNAYVVLFLLIPFINSGFEKLTKHEIEILLCSLLGLAVTVGVFGNLFIDSGYTGLWLVIMYMVGAYLKINKNFLLKISKLCLVLFLFVSAFISLVGEIISIKYIGHLHIWTAYNSPIVTAQSITFFLLFQQINIKNKNVKRLLKRYTALTFSVYLIDTNPYFFSDILKNALVFIREQNVFSGYILLLVISVGMFFIFLFFDFIRARLFGIFLKKKYVSR